MPRAAKKASKTTAKKKTTKKVTTKKTVKKTKTREETPVKSVVVSQKENNVVYVPYIPDHHYEFRPFLNMDTEGQMSFEELEQLPINKREELWESLNQNAGGKDFFPLLTRTERRQLRVVPLDEAVERGRAGGSKTKGTLYCPYCATTSPFKEVHNGYPRCIGCGISDMDYYVQLHNHLFASKK